MASYTTTQDLFFFIVQFFSVLVLTFLILLSPNTSGEPEVTPGLVEFVQFSKRYFDVFSSFSFIDPYNIEYNSSYQTLKPDSKEMTKEKRINLFNMVSTGTKCVRGNHFYLRTRIPFFLFKPYVIKIINTIKTCKHAQDKYLYMGTTIQKHGNEI